MQDLGVTNVVDTDAVALVISVVALLLLWVLVPPFFFQRLELSEIEQLQDSVIAVEPSDELTFNVKLGGFFLIFNNNNKEGLTRR